MPRSTSSNKDDTQVRSHIESVARAIRAKDLDALMAHYAPDVVTFDLPFRLQTTGMNAYGKNFEAWFAAVEGPIEYETQELHVTMNGDAAFCHDFAHVRSADQHGDGAGCA